MRRAAIVTLALACAALGACARNLDATDIPDARDPEPEVVDAVIRTLGKVKTAFVTAELEAPFAAYVRAVLGPADRKSVV